MTRQPALEPAGLTFAPDSPNDGFGGPPTVRAAWLDLTPVGTTIVSAGNAYANPFTGRTGIAGRRGRGTRCSSTGCLSARSRRGNRRR